MAAPLRRGSHVFRQLFDQESWTYTYILGCMDKKEAVIIDPVDVQAERDLQIIEEMGLKLIYAVNTHCHADHITGSGILKSKSNCQSAISRASGAKADIHLKDGDEIKYGNHRFEAYATPGHTNGCMTFVNHDEKFAMTGDALLIRGCGRTDFQEGDPEILYNSVHSRIFSLPDDFLLFPAHDYKGRMATSVQEEKLHNLRLTKSKEEFVNIMKNLGLAYPKKIDASVPWNLRCGPVQLGQQFES